MRTVFDFRAHSLENSLQTQAWWTHLVSSGERTQGSHVGTDSSWDGVRHVGTYDIISSSNKLGKDKKQNAYFSQRYGWRFVSAMSKLISSLWLVPSEGQFTSQRKHPSFLLWVILGTKRWLFAAL